MALERGALLNNRYKIVEILGQGGMGSVYRAVDENLGVDVAVKDNLFTTEEYARQFRREALILASLRHPNLPRVTDHFVIEKQGQYLVMDYIEGEDLRQRMERSGVLPEEEVIMIGAAICDALTYLSTRKPPIIHRDIKPGNVKITPQGQIYLVDFGLAKTMQGSQATTTGARAMTPGFSPPEQYGTARTDHRSDVFSLGATLYAALTGATPEDALARAMDQAELTPIRKHNPRISRRLAAAIEKALEVRPDDRYQSAEEFKQALLNSCSNTRRRESGDYLVEPAPMEEKSFLDENLQPEGDISALNSVKSTEAIGGLLSVSSVLTPAESAATPPVGRGRSRNWGCLLFSILIMSLITGVSFYVNAYQSDLRSNLLSQLPVVIIAPPSTIAPTLNVLFQPAELSPTQAIVTHTATASPTSSPPATATPTDIPPAPTDTPTPQPTPFGGGGQIAFVSDQGARAQIYIMNSDGSGLRQLTDLREGACQPDWSPDGKRLIFTSPCSSNSDYYPGAAMYIINEDGSGFLPLPTMKGGDFDPRWSPDGTKIAFTSLRNNNRPNIYILNLADYSVISLSEKYSVDFQPVWSPDGQQIIFISTTRRPGQQIWVVNADGSDARPLTNVMNALNSRASWSPDMSTVIFTQSVAVGGIPRVSTMAYDFNKPPMYRLGQESLPMRDAVFSPDGLWVAFEGWEVGGSSHSIFVMTITGAGLKQLTFLDRTEFDPIWKPVP